MSQNTLSGNMFGVGVSLWCAVLLILLTPTKEGVEAQELKSPAADFSRHRIVQPKVHHARTKRQISSTKDTSGAHHPELLMTVEVDGEEYQLELELNYALIPEGHVLQYQEHGNTVTHTPTREELELCQYHGKVRGKPSSRVALSTCHGVRGVIFDGDKIRYIEPAEGSDIQSQHYLYDHSDLNTKHHCGYDGGVTNNASDPNFLKKYNQELPLNRSARSVNRYKQHPVDSQVRGPYNENKSSRYVELVMIADYREFNEAGRDVRAVYQQFVDLVNIVNSMYVPLNIYVALTGVVVWSERDEIQLEEDSTTTLSKFLDYRKRLVTTMPNDNAALLTHQEFNNGVVGKANVGTMCTFDSSGSVIVKHSKVLGVVAATLAHEMGHNFGMHHDEEEGCQCADKKCIMNSYSTTVIPTRWSTCSIRALAMTLEKSMDICLRNKPKRLFASRTCGNGFVEPGEQCDCGLPLERGERTACHACCHADTCMLRANATCGAGTCCDLQTCRPKSAGTVCRSADRECDLPEYCTGHSEFCPDDVYKMDTTPCGSQHEAYCVRGSCRSHADQCRLLWGATGTNSHDKCYSNYNVGANKFGNCGYDRVRKSYRACAPEDVMCGRAQCHSYNPRPAWDMATATSNTHFERGVRIYRCDTVSVDVGLSDPDPGMVPDGAKCGDDKMCWNQRCLPVEHVRARIAFKASAVCPSNCSGHGVCNSEGHCHCEAGFSPPLCALPGAGGSVDSGPATDPAVLHKFMVAMYVIFLGIIPAILLILCPIYYFRSKIFLRWKDPRKTYVNSTHHNGLHKCTAKDFFTNNFRRFQNSTSSLRKLLSFKRNDSVDVDTTPPTVQPECSDNTTEPTKPPLPLKIPNLPNKSLKKTPPKKPFKKINKDDINIICETSDIKLKKPVPPPKPKDKPKLVIINQGLASTTNEMVSKGQKSSLYNIGNAGNNSNESGQNVKVHGFKK